MSRDFPISRDMIWASRTSSETWLLDFFLEVTELAPFQVIWENAAQRATRLGCLWRCGLIETLPSTLCFLPPPKQSHPLPWPPRSHSLFYFSSVSPLLPLLSRMWSWLVDGGLEANWPPVCADPGETTPQLTPIELNVFVIPMLHSGLCRLQLFIDTF